MRLPPRTMMTPETPEHAQTPQSQLLYIGHYRLSTFPHLPHCHIRISGNRTQGCRIFATAFLVGDATLKEAVGSKSLLQVARRKHAADRARRLLGPTTRKHSPPGRRRAAAGRSPWAIAAAGQGQSVEIKADAYRASADVIYRLYYRECRRH